MSIEDMLRNNEYDQNVLSERVAYHQKRIGWEQVSNNLQVMARNLKIDWSDDVQVGVDENGAVALQSDTMAAADLARLQDRANSRDWMVRDVMRYLAIGS